MKILIAIIIAMMLVGCKQEHSDTCECEECWTELEEIEHWYE